MSHSVLKKSRLSQVTENNGFTLSYLVGLNNFFLRTVHIVIREQGFIRTYITASTSTWSLSHFELLCAICKAAIDGCGSPRMDKELTFPLPITTAQHTHPALLDPLLYFWLKVCFYAFPMSNLN